MNNVCLLGRLTKNPIVTYTQSGSSIAKFGIAVDRRFKTDGGPTADFINVIAFGKTGEFVEKWFHKGDPIALTGRIQTGSYEKQDGTKVYTTDIIAEAVSFVPKPSSQQAPDAEIPEAPAAPAKSNDGFMDIPEGLSGDGLPF